MTDKTWRWMSIHKPNVLSNELAFMTIRRCSNFFWVFGLSICLPHHFKHMYVTYQWVYWRWKQFFQCKFLQDQKLRLISPKQVNSYPNLLCFHLLQLPVLPTSFLFGLITQEKWPYYCRFVFEKIPLCQVKWYAFNRTLRHLRQPT